MNKKVIIAISAVVIASCIIFIAFLVLNKNDTVSIKSIDTMATDNQRNVTITNRKQYQDTINSSYDADINETLVTYLQLSLKTVPENVTSTIRSNTYDVKNNAYGDVTSFIIDFTDLKISYKVTYSSDSSGYRAVYLKCLEASERIYPEIKCVDNTHE